MLPIDSKTVHQNDDLGLSQAQQVRELVSGPADGWGLLDPPPNHAIPASLPLSRLLPLLRRSEREIRRESYSICPPNTAQTHGPAQDGRIRTAKGRQNHSWVDYRALYRGLSSFPPWSLHGKADIGQIAKMAVILMW